MPESHSGFLRARCCQQITTFAALICLFLCIPSIRGYANSRLSLHSRANFDFLQLANLSLAAFFFFSLRLLKPALSELELCPACLWVEVPGPCFIYENPASETEQTAILFTLPAI
jgi:hypothetical protein